MFVIITLWVAALRTVIRWRCRRGHSANRFNLPLYKEVRRKVKQIRGDARDNEAPANDSN
jgi:hypothetical protein